MFCQAVWPTYVPRKSEDTNQTQPKHKPDTTQTQPRHNPNTPRKSETQPRHNPNTPGKSEAQPKHPLVCGGKSEIRGLDAGNFMGYKATFCMYKRTTRLVCQGNFASKQLSHPVWRLESWYWVVSQAPTRRPWLWPSDLGTNIYKPSWKATAEEVARQLCQRCCFKVFFTI